MKRSPTLTEQVRRHLKERIVNGEFDDGRIPPETELAGDLGVSRTTIRDALGRLESEGAIHRKQGAGTFVNRAGLQIKSRLEEIWSYEAVLRDHGYTPSVRIVSTVTEPADLALSQALDIDVADPVIVIEKLILEDEEPVVLTYNRIPEAYIAVPFDEQDCRRPIYEFLEHHAQRYLSYYLSEIVPTTATGRIATGLTIPSRTPLLSFHEIGHDRDNEPVVAATSYFRDDLLRFRLIRREAEA
jgi:GntR family transcriptional regulator